MSATTIPFAEDLDLPLEIVTQPCGILAVLEALIRVYPRELSPEEIEEATGYSATSSTLRNAASRLRGFELVEGRGSIRASDDLFV